MFRGKDNALQPNWLHLPVGYHGRVSTIHVTGHSFPRPRGQLQKNADKPQEGSTYGPSRLLDFELEVAAVVGGPPNAAPMDIDQAKSRIFGYMLMNDWSARDIQKWEYVPLGPFTSKNFATTVSAWIVPADSLEAFRIPTSAGTQSNPEPLDYLKDANYSSFDIRLSVAIQPPKSPTPHIVSRSNFRHLYWNPAQQLVHHSVTGCIMKAGDLLGSGTISGTEPSSFGSLLELSWKGTKEIPVGDEVRKFLKDGDTVLMRGCCEKEGYGRVGFGECLASVLPPAEKPSNSIGESVLPRYTNFKLYGYWRSSSTWRVRMVLEFKGITHETVPINLVNFEHREAAYLELNKFGQVPLLECLDTEEKKIVRVSQSLAIAEFLEEVTPGRRSIIPRDAVQRARIREMAEIVNAGIQPLQNLFHVKRLEELSGGSISATEEAKLAISRGLACLEALAIECQSESSGPYVGGTFAPSLADFCVLPQIANARRFGVDVEAVCPTLLTSETVCRSESWYESSHPEQQPGAPTRQSAKKLV
jgi:fumarylacetoacetase